MHALITGGTGFVGRRLLAKLDQPVVVSRDSAKAAKKLEPLKPKVVRWDPLRDPVPAEALAGVDTIFHLAGDPVAEGRWTEKKKQRIRDSRVIGTQNLVAGLAAAANKPKTLISASAVGYYGNCGDAEIDERSPPGHDFLAEVCIGWEREALAARDLGIRVVAIRTGVVLGEKGGALAKMLTPFQLGLGSPLGSGNQYMPWIHIDDLVELMLFAAREPSVSGPLNGTAPHPVTNREFTKTLGHVLGRPTFMPAVPPLALKILFGGFGQVLLDSQRVLPHAALAAGFAFKHPELEGALRDVLRR
jgi:uncharacterized protein (TIGR01777 family)